MVHHVRAYRSQEPVDEDAPVARGLAPVADGLEWIARLAQSKHNKFRSVGIDITIKNGAVRRAVR